MPKYDHQKFPFPWGSGPPPNNGSLGPTSQNSKGKYRFVQPFGTTHGRPADTHLHRVNDVLEKSLKMLEFGIKTSRWLKVLENR